MPHCPKEEHTRQIIAMVYLKISINQMFNLMSKGLGNTSNLFMHFVLVFESKPNHSEMLANFVRISTG